MFEIVINEAKSNIKHLQRILGNYTSEDGIVWACNRESYKRTQDELLKLQEHLDWCLTFKKERKK